MDVGLDRREGPGSVVDVPVLDLRRPARMALLDQRQMLVALEGDDALGRLELRIRHRRRHPRKRLAAANAGRRQGRDRRRRHRSHVEGAAFQGEGPRRRSPGEAPLRCECVEENLRVSAAIVVRGAEEEDGLAWSLRHRRFAVGWSSGT